MIAFLKMSRKAQSIKRENRLVVSWSWDRNREWSDINLLKLDYGMSTCGGLCQ
jgi:hypothetical protein